jgi:hypothetical protein
MNIDWSKAPEGATHFDAADNRINSFMKLEGGRWFFWPPNSLSPAWTYWKPENTGIKGMIPRPPEWNGEGLPPVGTVCEFQGDEAKCPYDPWHEDLHDGVKCTVIAHFKSKSLDLVAFTFVKSDGNTEVEQSLPGALKPIRTPEQIAAEERSRRCIEISNLAWAALSKIDSPAPALSKINAISEALYDAGYRLQVAP